MNEKPTHIFTKNILAVKRHYFEHTVLPSLEKARAHAQATIKHYRIAGKNIKIYLYGNAIAQTLTLALAHNEIKQEAQADLTIHAWDSIAANYVMNAPWDEPDFTEEQVSDTASFLGVYLSGEETLNFYDPKTATGYFYVHDAAQLPDWVLGAPFRAILHWFLSDHGIHFVHSAVVGENGASVLLTAKSGSGKSTTALASVLAGMDYLADDYVAIEAGNGVTAHGLYHSAKITAHGVSLFPEFENIIWNKGFNTKEKAVIFLSDLFPKQVKTTSNVRAIFIPRITGGETRLVPANKLEAMIAIVPTTLFQLPLAETKKFSAFKNVVEKIPCYILELGPDIRAVPNIIKHFLQNHD